MSDGSPAAYLLWAILSCLFLVFLVLHLWAFDRFNCVRWKSGRQPGAFKRVMTYSYLATVPLLVVFSVAMTALKFSEGYSILPSGKIVPKPLALWERDNKHWLLPLYILLSIAWSLELVTHLEELAFWLFLLHQGPEKRQWFYSWEFRAWCTGSVVAVMGMPLTTIVARRSIEMCRIYIFLVGSCAGTATTLCFLYVLLRFPSFVRHVKAEGAEPGVVVRLATFYQLNLIRVIFRFLFTIPFIIIAADAIQPSSRVVRSLFAMDFLLMLGGFGCFASSGITLLIFFPRSLTHEEGYRVEVITPQVTQQTASCDCQETGQNSKTALAMELPSISTDIMYHDPSQFNFQSTCYSHAGSVPRFLSSRESLNCSLSPGHRSEAEMKGDIPTSLDQPEMRWSRQDELSLADCHPRRHDIRATISLPARLRGPFQSVHSSSQLHPYVLYFTSPIDLVDSSVHETKT